MRCSHQNFILGKETGKRRDTGDRQHGDPHHRTGGRHRFAQPAHLKDIGFVMQRM